MPAFLCCVFFSPRTIIARNTVIVKDFPDACIQKLFFIPQQSISLHATFIERGFIGRGISIDLILKQERRNKNLEVSLNDKREGNKLNNLKFNPYLHPYCALIRSKI